MDKFKNFTRSKSIRMSGNLTSYRFLIKHKSGNAFTVDEPENLEYFFKRAGNLILKKVLSSVIAKNFKRIIRITYAIKGEATIDSPSGGDDFPLWRAITDSVTATNKTEFETQYDITRNAVLEETQSMFYENNPNNYYEESSSTATSMTIDESLLYIETQPIKKHLSNEPTKKKKPRTKTFKKAPKRKRKNSGVRPRNKRLDKGKKSGVLRRRKPRAIRRRKRVTRSRSR